MLVDVMWMIGKLYKKHILTHDFVILESVY